MTEPVDVRRNMATQDEILQHLVACEHLFVPPLTQRVDLETYARKIRNHALTVEAWELGKLAGLVAAYFNEGARSCYVTSVSVLPSRAGSGVATRLMQELVACAVERGAHRMVLEVAKGAAAARRLYERQGFVLDQDRRDTVVLRRDLPSSVPATARPVT